MSNLAQLLKEEIARQARRVTRPEVTATRRTSAQHRRELAQLKRAVADLSRRVAFLERQEKRRATARPLAAEADNHRFSPRWLKMHRERLGLSAAEYGNLVGVSQLTIYNWENGKARPRPRLLPALAQVRAMRKREATQRLQMMA